MQAIRSSPSDQTHHGAQPSSLASALPDDLTERRLWKRAPSHFRAALKAAAKALKGIPYKTPSLHSVEV
jgi:hypothetical protein